MAEQNQRPGHRMQQDSIHLPGEALRRAFLDDRLPQQPLHLPVVGANRFRRGFHPSPSVAVVVIALGRGLVQQRIDLTEQVLHPALAHGHGGHHRNTQAAGTALRRI
jgi:hypothetical protein